MALKSICVFCGSSDGARPEYADAAEDLGQRLAGAGLKLIYGGAKVGLMGRVADAALAAGGKVTGVLPTLLREKELAHEGLTEFHEVGSMHERKALMADLADGFISLPGGAGTMEEVFEVWTWAQLGYHEKPVGFLNVNGYYEKLFSFIEHIVAEEFLRQQHADMLLIEPDAESLIKACQEYEPTHVTKWITGTTR